MKSKPELSLTDRILADYLVNGHMPAALSVRWSTPVELTSALAAIGDYRKATPRPVNRAAPRAERLIAAYVAGETSHQALAQRFALPEVVVHDLLRLADGRGQREL